MAKIITVEGLEKSFGEIHAVEKIDFSVEAGSLFAFLGPNGAGKSTTMDMLCTLLKPDGGAASLNGHTLGREDEAIRRDIGVVFQTGVLDPLLTVEENLHVRGRFYGLSGQKLKEGVRLAARTADVSEFLRRPYGKLSGGQRRRADIARALIHTPKILFLDEPTTGLDPKTKEGVWNTISALQKQTGMTVFLTTHYMEEAAAADQIVLMVQGHVAVQGTPYELKEQYAADTLRCKPRDQTALQRILEESGLPFYEENGFWVAQLPGTRAALPILQQAESFLESFEVIHGSMEDVFLNLTRGGLNRD